MLTIMTELDAVNIMLNAIGSDPINSLPDSTDVDVANALRLLEKTSRSIQIKGWDFNTGTYTLYPNKNDNKILWDNSIMSYSSQDNNTYVKRGDYLYDMTNQTDTFDKEIILDVIVAVDYEDLPSVFKTYVAVKAALDFQMRYVADQSVQPALQMDVMDAYADIVEYDINMSDVNMLQLSNIAGVLQRS